MTDSKTGQHHDQGQHPRKWKGVIEHFLCRMVWENKKDPENAKSRLRDHAIVRGEKAAEKSAEDDEGNDQKQEGQNRIEHVKKKDAKASFFCPAAQMFFAPYM